MKSYDLIFKCEFGTIKLEGCTARFEADKLEEMTQISDSMGLGKVMSITITNLQEGKTNN